MKFLRVLQEHAFERVGGTQTIKVDIRVIAATKKNLLLQVKKNAFREDLFYRLNVVSIKLPSLRERSGDIPLLLNHFIQKYSKGKQYEVTSDTLMALSSYSWPGNVRELENSVERAITMAGDSKILKKEELLKSPVTLVEGKDVVPLESYLKQCEADYLRKIFSYTNGDKNEICRLLDISRKTLWTKLKEYSIET
jgi:transcriptional regulator with PAS, ATPase and Fis domain